MRPCVHPPRVEFLFSPVLWSSCHQAPLAFKAKCSGGSSSLCQIPRLGSQTWGSELSLLWENLCDTIIFQFVGHPPSRYGIWLYHKYALLLSCCGFFFVFGHRISFFGRFQSFLLMVVQQIVVVLVFSWEEVSSSPSTLSSCPRTQSRRLRQWAFLKIKKDISWW